MKLPLIYPLVPFAFLLLCHKSVANSYSTTFSTAENPIFESGNWVNGKVVGLDWNNVRTSAKFAYGTQSGTDGVDDSTALLVGNWAPDQTAQAIVHIVKADGAEFEEVELRLRSNLSAHTCTGYEILFSVKASTPYVQIVRWNGAFNEYSLLNNSGSAPIVRNGDLVKATIVGNTITAYVNGSAVCVATDSTWETGNPGIGFYLQSSVGSATNYGFSEFSVTDGSNGLPSAPILNIPSIDSTSGLIDLSGQGSSNQSYTFQCTDNLGGTNWQNIGTVTSDVSGKFIYVDNPGPLITNRYYRVVTP